MKARESKFHLSEKLGVDFAQDGKFLFLSSGAKSTSSFSDKSNLLSRAVVTSLTSALAVAVENQVYIISLMKITQTLIIFPFIATTWKCIWR